MYFCFDTGMAGGRLSTLCKWTRLHYLIGHCKLHSFWFWETQIKGKVLSLHICIHRLQYITKTRYLQYGSIWLVLVVYDKKKRNIQLNDPPSPRFQGNTNSDVLGVKCNFHEVPTFLTIWNRRIRLVETKINVILNRIKPTRNIRFRVLLFVWFRFDPFPNQRVVPGHVGLLKPTCIIFVCAVV